VRTRRLVPCLAAAAVLAAILAGCGGSSKSASSTTTSASSGKPIVIGFATAESGAFAAYDIPAVQGAKLKIAEINAQGGLDGRLLKFVSADTKTDIAQARVAADEVLGKGAKFLMTTCDFDYGAPSALEAEKQNVVAFSSCAGSNKFRPATFGPLAFSMAVATPAESAAVAEFAYDQKKLRTAYVLVDPSIDQTKQSAQAFTDRWMSLGGTIVGQDTFQQGDQSIAAQITRVQDLPKPPDAIYVSSYPPGGARAIRQVRAAGIKSTILGDSNFDGDYWVSSIPGLTNYYHDAYAAIDGKDPNAKMNAVVADFRKTYGHPPDTSLGFTSGYSVIEALARGYNVAKTTDGKELAKAFESFRNVPLLIGPTTFNTQTHITPKRPVRIIAITDGRPVYVTTLTAKEVPSIQ